MSIQHHGPDDERARQRFLEEVMGTSKREFPNGRIEAGDDGESAYAIATDMKHKVIRIKFTKPMEWVGLDYEAAEQLRDALSERMLELRGITV